MKIVNLKRSKITGYRAFWKVEVGSCCAFDVFVISIVYFFIFSNCLRYLYLLFFNNGFEVFIIGKQHNNFS